MKNLLLGGILLSLFSSCVAPINTTYESARMLKRGDSEIMGHYTHYSVSSEGETDAINDNFGVRIGYGIGDKFNLKVRYERLVPKDEDSEGVNYVDIAPKFQIMQGNIAATMPIGLYFAEDETEFVLSPKFIFTYPANDKFEISLATKADIFPEGDGNVYLGFNLGLGISTNLDQWALRPELGYMIDPGESGSFWAYGIGLVGTLPGRHSRAVR